MCAFFWNLKQSQSSSGGKYSVCSLLIDFLTKTGGQHRDSIILFGYTLELKCCPPTPLCCSQVGCLYFQKGPQETQPTCTLAAWVKPNRQCVGCDRQPSWMSNMAHMVVCVRVCVCACVCAYSVLTVLGSMDSADFVMPSKHFPTMGSTWRSTSANVFMHTPSRSILFSSMSWSFYIKIGTISIYT